MATKIRKYILIGLLVDIVVPLAASALLALHAAYTYEGRCITIVFMGGGPCTRFEYVAQVVGLVWLVGWMAAIENWWIVLPALLIAPLIGYAVGRLRSEKSFR
jgi:hypothetical protein